MSEEEAGKGEAPPEGGSQKGEGDDRKHSGENRIPMSRVNEMIAAKVTQAVAEVRAEIGPLLAELKALKEAKPADKPAQQFTKAQLAVFVEEGKLTQDAADTVWENQIVERATRKAVEGARIVVETGEKQRTVAQQMAEFQTLIPDAWEEGTPEREQVRKAYKRLTGSGLTGTREQLELAAMIATFGDPADIRKARGHGRNGPADSFEDSGDSGGRRRKGEGDDADGAPKGLTQAQRTHYEKGIAAGRYKGWTDVREELKFATAKRA